LYFFFQFEQLWKLNISINHFKCQKYTKKAISLLVKKTNDNANVEKKEKEKNTKNTNETESNYRKRCLPK